MEISSNIETDTLPEVEATNSVASTVSDSSNTIQTTETPKTETDAFSAFLLRSLGKSEQDNVNEEELYSSIIEDRLSKLSQKAADSYTSAKASQRRNFSRSDGYVYVEKASLAGLKDVVTEGLITEQQAMKVNGEAFAAAQLDDNTELLFDGRGSSNDPTIAVSSMASAMFRIKEMMQKLDAGDLTIDPKELVEPSNSALMHRASSFASESHGDEGITNGLSNKSSDQQSGTPSISTAEPEDDTGFVGLGISNFTWEPSSGKDGKLAVLLPSALESLIERVEIRDKFGKVIDSTNVTEKNKDKSRPVVRFSKPGADYGKELEITVSKTDGTETTFRVADGAKYDDQPTEGQAAALNQPDVVEL